MDLSVTSEQLKRWQEGENDLVVMPNLTHDQLEFLTIGMNCEERRQRFGPLAV